MPQIVKAEAFDTGIFKRGLPGRPKIAEPVFVFSLKNNQPVPASLASSANRSKIRHAKVETGTFRGGVFFDLIIETALFLSSKSEIATCRI